MEFPLRIEEAPGGYVVKSADGAALSVPLSMKDASKLACGANLFPAFVKIFKKLLGSGEPGAPYAEAERLMKYLGNYAE